MADKWVVMKVEMMAEKLAVLTAGMSVVLMAEKMADC
jgi:hypothetical protein